MTPPDQMFDTFLARMDSSLKPWNSTKNAFLVAVLILLSIIMLLVGGGLIPPILGVIAGIVGTRIKHSESTKHGGLDS